MILRKALDKVLVESQLPNIKKAEDDLVQELRDKSVNEKEAAHEKEAATGRELQLLVEDLNELLQEVRYCTLYYYLVSLRFREYDPVFF